jgi:tripartite-type tricarboxylate transporter receptor subunit TctC
MNADVVAVLKEPQVREKLENLGLAIVGSTPQEMGAFLQAEMSKWGPVIKDAGIIAQ